MTSTTGPSAKRPAAAFTLLELIVVLVLVSVVLAVAAPSLRRFAHGRETADAAGHLLALTHLARAQAASEGRPYRLNIDPEEGTYWLTAQEGGAFVELARDYGRLFRLPDGVAVEVQVTPMPTETTVYVAFYPDGRSDAAVIDLRDADGRGLRVACPSVSERFRIETLQEGAQR